MFKNVAGQKAYLYAYDASTGLPKTGDAANISLAVSKDGAAPGKALSQRETKCTRTARAARVQIVPMVS